jgi:GTP-binding protein HflX
MNKDTTNTMKDPERILLLGIESEESLDELAALVDTAGGLVVTRMLQKRDSAEPNTYVGKGKLDEIKEAVKAEQIDLVVTDDELNGVQVRNIADTVETSVIDRTELILDIFAQHAKTREGALQVELALLVRSRSRLVGEGKSLSRQAGGIGTRGPGESKLEIDRRRIRERINLLRGDITELAKDREVRRATRRENAVPSFALVGYTNAGKSTLINLLTDAGVLAENKLFATLDPVTRKLKLPSGESVLITDTVGFIRKLPTALIDAFHSTLEEAAIADALIIISDASSEHLNEHRKVVMETLARLKADGKPIIDVLNKTDIAEVDISYINAVPISALTGVGIDTLFARMDEVVYAMRSETELLIPYSSGDILAYLHNNAVILSETYEDEGTRVRVSGTAQVIGKTIKELSKVKS